MEEENWEERAEALLESMVDILHPIVSNDVLWTVALEMRRHIEQEDDESQRES